MNRMLYTGRQKMSNLSLTCSGLVISFGLEIHTTRQTGLTGIFHDVEEQHRHNLSCRGTGRGMPTRGGRGR